MTSLLAAPHLAAQERTAESTARSDQLNAGALAAAVVAAGRPVLSDRELVEGMERAEVIAPWVAAQLLAGWPDGRQVDTVRSWLASPGAIAVALPAATVKTPSLLLYVARVRQAPASAPTTVPRGLAFLLARGVSRGQTCHRCIETGARGGSCVCQETCQQIPCGNDTHVSTCRDGCPQTADGFSIDYQAVQELFGDDPRFLCSLDATELRSGDVLLSACDRTRPTPAAGHIEGTIGELAAAVVASLSEVTTDEVPARLGKARVLSGDEALALLRRHWSPGRGLKTAQVVLARDAARALLVPALRREGDGPFLYIPAPDAQTLVSEAKNVRGFGYLLEPQPPTPDTCEEYHNTGRFGDRWMCNIIFRQVPCPAHSVDTCHVCRASPDWSPEEPWMDPVPHDFAVVRELFGTADARFACAVPAEQLEPGTLLFELCR